MNRRKLKTNYVKYGPDIKRTYNQVVRERQVDQEDGFEGIMEAYDDLVKDIPEKYINFAFDVYATSEGYGNKADNPVWEVEVTYWTPKSPEEIKVQEEKDRIARMTHQEREREKRLEKYLELKAEFEAE